MKMDYKVSVIIPVYNAEKTIGACLQSLLSQTLQEIELIVINDASTDNSLAILKDYENRFQDRVKVISLTNNHGAGGARNYGIEAACGQYIGFVDSDDVVASTMYEKLYQAALQNDYDVVDCGFYQEEKDLAIIFTGDELTGELDAQQREALIVSGGYIWSKLYKRTLFEDTELRFREKVILEDADFLTYVFATIHSIGNVKEILYHYKNTENSASKVVDTDKYCHNILEAMIHIHAKVQALPVYDRIQDAVEYEMLQMYSYGINLCTYSQKKGVDCAEYKRQLVNVRHALVRSGYENPYVQKKIKEQDIAWMQQADSMWEKKPLSVCIITKNEAGKLKECLRRLIRHSFEVVVTDTGSSDDSVAIATAYADKVTYFTWCDDFAAAKNAAVQAASNDMVMVLDTDEYIEELKEEELFALIQKNSGKIGRIQRLNRFERNGESTEVKEYINRIFDRREYQYKGRIHEQLVRITTESDETYLTGVIILHDGYDGDEAWRREKAERNARLLQKELEENPEDTYLMYQLGKSYYMAGDYPKAVKYFELALGYDLDPKLEYVIDMVETYGYALLNSGQAETALLLESVYDAFGNTADFKFLMGLIYMNNERYEDAVAEFLKATRFSQARTTGVNSYLAYYNAGVIRECLGDLKQAKQYYEKCKTYAKAAARIAVINGKGGQNE